MKEINQRRIDAVMLESLSGSFDVMSKGGPVIFSFNHQDISEMLNRAAKIVSPVNSIRDAGLKHKDGDGE